MLAIKNILFPIDFSERCCGAAPFVQAMANRFGSKVTLMSVMYPFWQTGMNDASAAVPVDTTEFKHDLEARLDSAFVREFAGIPVERVVEIGEPAEAITRFAASEGIDLIMMPTHGYGPFRSLLLGSITAKVLHDAECPVWTATHIEEPPARAHLACRNVLCAIDATPKSVPLMQWAAQFAKDNEGTLRLVHAVSGVEGWPERQLEPQFEEHLRRDAHEKIERLQQSIGISAPSCVAIGDVAGAVREEAHRHGADLIVIGRGILHETLGRLRTHSYGIIRHAPCPVLSV